MFNAYPSMYMCFNNCLMHIADVHFNFNMYTVKRLYTALICTVLYCICTMYLQGSKKDTARSSRSSSFTFVTSDQSTSGRDSTCRPINNENSSELIWLAGDSLMLKTVYGYYEQIRYSEKDDLQDSSVWSLLYPRASVCTCILLGVDRIYRYGWAPRTAGPGAGEPGAGRRQGPAPSSGRRDRRN